MPFSIKDSTKEHFDESLEVFEGKGQSIFNALKNSLKSKQVYYDRLKQYEQNYYKPKMNYHKQVRLNNR